MPSRLPWRLAVAATVAAAFATGAWAALDPQRAALALALVAGALLVAVALWLEREQGAAREIALVAALAAVAAAGRVLLAPVPGVQPLTVIAIASGAALGARAGAAVGAAAALASNTFLGQGVWTPWQMLGWAACGVAGALLARGLRSRVVFAVVACVLGLAFSALMDLWEWIGFLPHTWQALALQMTRGFPFQVAHAAGNVVFALAVGPGLVRLIGRYGRRLRTTVEWEPATLAAVLAVAGAVSLAGLGGAQSAGAAAVGAGADLARAAAYLESRQQPDGGFAEPDGRSDPTLTAWVALGLAAARPASPSLAAAAAYLRGADVASITDLELRIVALAALGEDTSALVGQLEREISPGGRIGPALNSTIWGALALRAAGEPLLASTLAELRRSQASNGGFSWFRGREPDSNDTAAAVQALVAAGIGPQRPVVRRALAYLAGLRARGGGYPLGDGDPPDAQSTAWALQARAAAGLPADVGSIRFLARLQRDDGSFRYRRGRSLTPVWVTAQVLPALAGRPFPLAGGA